MLADGVTSALATFITGPVDAMCRCIRTVCRAIESDARARSLLTGLHVEGPFLSPKVGFIGAHPAECVQASDLRVLGQILDAGGQWIRYFTLAPEIDVDGSMTAELVKRRILVAAGHTDASIDELLRCIDCGLSLFTHLGNACPMQVHRHDNIIQRALSLADRLRYTFIADGWHLPDFFVRNLLKLIPLDRLAVVSDAISAAGLGPGEYQLGKRLVKIGPDRAARSPDGQHFVGAASKMVDADRWLAQRVCADPHVRRQLLYDNPRLWLEQTG
jgi:N-acetylglucosamine-6-phosphate deacetylase